MVIMQWRAALAVCWGLTVLLALASGAEAAANTKVPTASHAPTSMTASPTARGRTSSPTVDFRTIEIASALLDSKMALTVTFSSPIAFYAVNDKPVKRLPCALVFSAPEFYPENGKKEVSCRVAGDGLSVTSDALDISASSDFSRVISKDGAIVSTEAGNARLGSLLSPISMDGALEPKPTVKLQESSCGNIYFSWTQSKGNVKKPWANAEWTVSGTPAAVATEMAASLNSRINDKSETVLSRYELDSRSHGRRFVARLRLTNWLGNAGLSDPINIDLSSIAPSNANGNATTAITIVGTPVTKSTVPFGEPEFVLSGPTSVDIRSDFQLEVNYAFPIERCTMENSGPISGPQYPIWQTVSGPFPRGFRGIFNRGDPYKYMVLGGQLGVGQYTFGVQVSRHQTLQTTMSVTFDSMVNVWGGNRSLTADETAELRLGEEFTNDSLASIQWSCRRIQITVGDIEEGKTLEWALLADPEFFFQPGTSCTGAIQGTLNPARGSKSVSIPSDVLAYDYVYLIYAQFRLYAGGAVLESLPSYILRSTEFGFSVQIDTSTQPIVGQGKVNVNNPIIIRTQSEERHLKFQWSQDYGDLDDSTLRKLNLDKSFLRIPANTLSPGQRYVFRLSVANAPGLFTSITFFGNDSPSGGYAMMTPSEGYAGETDFTMQASYFIDDDLPLSYSWVIAKRDCFLDDCFTQPQAAVFKTLTPFVPDSGSTTKLEYYPNPQTIGCIAQDALGAASGVVLANSTVLVRKPARSSSELVANLQQAISTSEDGSKVWTDVLAALSNFDSDVAAKAVQPELLQQVLEVAQGAANYAPRRISSMVIENQIPGRIISRFKDVLNSNPGLVRMALGSIDNVLNRTKSILEESESQSSQASLSEGDLTSLRSITEDTLSSCSDLLSRVPSSESIGNAALTIPQAIISRLVEVQLAIPMKVQGAQQERYYSSQNIDSSFLVRFYEEIANTTSSSPITTEPDGLPSMVLHVQPNPSQWRNGFVLPAKDLVGKMDAGNASGSLVFFSSVHYRINPFAREDAARNQSLAVGGVTSLQVFKGESRSPVDSFNLPLQIRMEFDKGSPMDSEPGFARELQRTRTVNGANATMPARNVTERLFCGFFDFDQRKWSDFGCSVHGVGQGMVTCSCNHTTDYAAWVETINEIVLTFTDVSNFSNVKDGIPVLIILLLWIVGTVLFLIWGYYLDNRDMERRVRSILFSLKLKRLRDQRVKHRVFRAWRNQVLKESGALIDSSAPLPPALSSLVSIERRNRRATQPPPDLRVDLSTTPKRMWHFFNVSLFREHTLLNTIYLLDPFLTRPMRVLCGAAVVLGEMFAAAVFYHFDNTDDVSVGMQIAVALLSIVLVSPVVGLFVVLSRRVAATPGAQRRYLQQMMVILIAEMGEDRRGEDVHRWAKFAKHVTWDDLKEIHRLQSIKLRVDILKQQHPQTAETKKELRRLQQELAAQKQVVMDKLADSSPKSLRKRLTLLHEQNRAFRGGSNVDEPANDFYALPLSSNTSLWLQKVSSAASEPPAKRTSFVSLTSPLKSRKESVQPPKSPRLLAAFTPRPFRSETPRLARGNQHDSQEDDDGDGNACRVRVRRCCTNWFARPALYCLRARPTSWYRSTIPPPESDYYLSHKWIYVSYLILFLYYALAFFYILSWGFRSGSEGVLNWLPTVAFSVFIDLVVLQPFLIFVRFVVMNEIAYRMDQHEFVSLEYVSARNNNINNPSSNNEPADVRVVFGDGLSRRVSHDDTSDAAPTPEMLPSVRRAMGVVDEQPRPQHHRPAPPPPPPPSGESTEALALV